jgi:hypothetical protein
MEFYKFKESDFDLCSKEQNGKKIIPLGCVQELKKNNELRVERFRHFQSLLDSLQKSLPLE